MSNIIKLDNLAGGAFNERVNQGIREVLENIADPNTDFKVKRKLDIELVFVTDEEREMTQVEIKTKTKLAPKVSVGTKFIIDRQMDGEIIGTEFKKQIPGQQAIKVNAETGEVVENKVEKLEPGLQLVK